MVDFFSKYVSKTTLLIFVCFILGGAGYYHFNHVVLTCEAFAKEKAEIYKEVKLASAKTRLDTLYLHRSLLQRDIDRYEDLMYATPDPKLKDKYRGRIKRVEKEMNYVNDEIRKLSR